MKLKRLKKLKMLPKTINVNRVIRNPNATYHIHEVNGKKYWHPKKRIHGKPGRPWHKKGK